MKLISLLSLLPPSLATTVYLAGDSTMAHSTSNIDGWGNYIATSLKSSISLTNAAIGGRSARSFTREGRFDAIASSLESGDYVVIEFGHNDGGSLSTDNGRTDCSGTGDEVCYSEYNGVNETILTFPKYLENAAAMFKAKGATVLISSQKPNNPFESGSFVYSPNRFVEYAELAASVAGVEYVDHGAYVASIFESLGADTVNAYFPNDHTHTSPAGAQVVADAFLKAVVCGGVKMKNVLSTTDFDGSCL